MRYCMRYMPPNPSPEQAHDSQKNAFAYQLRYVSALSVPVSDLRMVGADIFPSPGFGDTPWGNIKAAEDLERQVLHSFLPSCHQRSKPDIAVACIEFNLPLVTLRLP